MRERGIVESFNAAIEGFIYVLKTQRNMRVHFLIAVLVVLLAIVLNFSALHIGILCITIMFVLVSEMLNTAIELIVDMVQSEFHPIARIIKDVSAGAVLLVAFNALIVGYVLFAKTIPLNIEVGVERLRESPWHLTFMSIILVLALTIAGKIIFHKGTPMRGGMPSGHAAFAFSLWTAIAFMTNNSIIIILAFVMAFLIARHRVKYAIHTVWEVIVGSLLGVLVTTFIFQLFR
ncbi:MAG: diacylglycerol kinase [Candidatus Omnitrophica bacterium]|nr:diacylglycerol kinase [Candidatus Omnitrophota bacterium]